MSTQSAGQSAHGLKTATAVADPVLVRLATSRGMVVVLAGDLTYDKAATMRFHDVRWVRAPRRLGAFFSARREPATGRRSELILRKVGGKIMGTLPSEGWLQTPATRQGFAMLNITAEQYALHRKAPPRRLLLLAGAQIAPKPSPFANAMQVIAHAQRILHMRLAAKVVG